MAKPDITKRIIVPTPEPVKDDDVKRISFVLTADGKRIDWSKVRESRRPEIEKLLGDDPRVRALVVPVSVELPIANRALTDAIVNTLGQVEAALASRLYGMTIDEALSVCQFSPAETTVLADPLERVINKYGSTLLLKYGDELALGVLVLSFTRAKLAAAQALKHRKHESQPPVNRENTQNM